MSNTNQHLERAKEALEESGQARVAGKWDLAGYYLDVARTQAALAAVEEQRTANLIAADAADLLSSPHQVGTAEHTAYWQAHTAALAERLAVQQ